MKDLTVESLYAEILTRVTGERQDSEKQGAVAYSHPEFGQIRVVMREGEPWFVVRDVCAVLKTRTNDALGSLDDDERGYDNIVSPSGVQQMGIVSEPGLYSLLLRSRARKDDPALSEKLRRFKRWVTHDVLPSIRKTGAYSMAGVEMSASWLIFLDRVNVLREAVDPGFFSVFTELAHLIPSMIALGIPLNEHTVPDVSVGLAWSKHWNKQKLEEMHGLRKYYPHSYPGYFKQAKSNPQDAWQYPEAALPEFRKWLREDYLPHKFPHYLQRQQSKGALTSDTVAKAIALAPWYNKAG